MAFAQRKINVQFQLGQGDFGEGGFDTVTLEGLRCSVNIVRQGIGFANAELQIFGMTLDQMNKLTVLNKLYYPQWRLNQVIVLAGDDQSGMAVCFAGTIREAWVDARQAPDVSFFVSADSAMFELMKPVPPISFKGTVDAALVLAGIAEQMGLSLENSGVTAQLTTPYYPGSIKSQLEAVCRHVNCNYDIDESNSILAVWPKGKARGSSAVLISSDTGMIGYPSFTQGGIRFSTLYNPSLAYGNPVIVESQLKGANGQWSVYQLAHRLESNVPNGEWFSDVECSYLGYAP